MDQRLFNRRRFFKQLGAAASLAVPIIVPAAVLGRGDLPAAGERVTVAMLGTGRQANFVNLRQQFLVMPDVQIVALCDVDRWRLGETGKLVETQYAPRRKSGQYKGCLTTGDYREVLARDDIDAVMIAAYSTDDVQAVVTWNPLVAEIMAIPGTTKLFDSADIPGGIVDLMVVITATLAANADFG